MSSSQQSQSLFSTSSSNNTNTTTTNNNNNASGGMKKVTASIPISLGKPSLRLRLEAYYSLINPSVLQDVNQWKHQTFEQIYKKYGGTIQGEKKLQLKLIKKYGNPQIKLLLAPSNTTPSTTHTTTIPPTRSRTTEPQHQKRDEQFYETLIQRNKNTTTLSFVSSDFNPILCLSNNIQEVDMEKENNFVSSTTTNSNIIRKKGKLFNHIQECRALLPQEDPLYLKIQQPPATKATGPTTKASSASTNKLVVATSKLPFHSIANHTNLGPFSLLYDILEKKQRIRILIRYVNGIRGTITGYLLAYDKHMNMILRDVDEVYTPRIQTKRQDDDDDDDENDNNTTNTDQTPTLSNLDLEINRRVNAYSQANQTTTPAKNPKRDYQSNYSNERNATQDSTKKKNWSVRQRYMKQILVRGDNVVLVYRAEQERSVYPHTSKSPTSSIYYNKKKKVNPSTNTTTNSEQVKSISNSSNEKNNDNQKRKASEGLSIPTPAAAPPTTSIVPLSATAPSNITNATTTSKIKQKRKRPIVGTPGSLIYALQRQQQQQQQQQQRQHYHRQQQQNYNPQQKTQRRQPQNFENSSITKKQRR